MKKFILACFTMFLLLIPGYFYAQDTIPKTIVYGGDEAFPPYEFLNKKGKPEGLNIDLIRAIAKKIGFNVKIEMGPWYKIANKLENTDSIQVASMYFSEKRTQLVSFANPIEVGYYELYLRKGHEPFLSLKDLNGKTIAVEKGSVLEEYFTRNYPELKLLSVSSEIAALEALSQGKCYAAFASNISNFSLISKNSFKNLVKYHKPFIPRFYSFAVKKGNSKLLNLLNLGLLQIQEEGIFHKLREKWIIRSQKSWLSRNWEWILVIVITLIIWFIIWIVVLRYSVKRKTKQLGSANSRLKLIASFKPTRIDKISAQEQVTELLEHIKETFKADACIVRILKDNQLELFESVGTTGKNLQESVPTNEGFGKKIISARKALGFTDVSKEKSHVKLKKKYPNLLGFSSYGGAPLIFENQVIGIIGIYFTHNKRKLSSTELEQFQIVADQLAVSFANTRLFEQNEKQKEILVKQIISRKAAEAELQKSFQTANMLYETSRNLNLSMDIEIVGNSILMSLEKLLKWQRSSIWLVDENRSKLLPIAHADMGLTDDELKSELKRLKKIIKKPGDGIIGWVVLEGKKVRSGNISTDKRYLETYPGVKSELCVPIIFNESSIGCINIESVEEDAFSEEDDKLLTTLANLASSAIQNVRLFEKLNIELKERTRAEKEVEKLNKDLELRVEQRTEELQNINKELESFVYSISHDLRAPLRSIMGFSEIISQRYMNNLNDEGQEYFNYILESSKYMSQLINDLLQFSRLARNPLFKSPVDLNVVLQKVKQNLNQDIKEKKANIILSGEIPMVKGDKSLIGQIFSNLIQNAIKYNRKGTPPEVFISTEEEAEHVIVKVKDNGQGIPQEHFDKIFDIFQRLHSSDKYPGTGIGLAIVKKAVKALGGKIWLESKVDEGTTFFIRFLKN